MRSNVIGGLLVVVFGAAALWDMLPGSRARPHLFWLVTGIALLVAALYFRLLWPSVVAGAFVLWSASDVRHQRRRRRP
jgi:hypothetical protein